MRGLGGQREDKNAATTRHKKHKKKQEKRKKKIPKTSNSFKHGVFLYLLLSHVWLWWKRLTAKWRECASEAKTRVTDAENERRTRKKRKKDTRNEEKKKEKKKR